MRHAIDRRQFLKTTAIAVIGASSLAAARKLSPNEKLNIGGVGAGGRAMSVLGGLASGIAASGALLLLLAWYGVRRATASALQPLSGLASQVATIDANSLTNRVTVERLPPDLIPIAGQINDLMARLEAALDRERRFAGNAAHELLTPVSELRLASENALEWPNDLMATSSLASLSSVAKEQLAEFCWVTSEMMCSRFLSVLPS